MRWMKILAIVLGAVWFLPVSCIMGVWVGTRIAAKLDEREVVKGDTVHAAFLIVAEPGEKGMPFMALPLNDTGSFKQTGKSGSFFMSKPSGTIDSKRSEISYQVLTESGPEQLIEVVEQYHDGDNTIWSRYKATRSEVTPVSSRMFYFGYMFQAVPYAFCIALFLFFIGRLLRRQENKATEKADG
jgi:hypothetical protein